MRFFGSLRDFINVDRYGYGHSYGEGFDNGEGFGDYGDGFGDYGYSYGDYGSGYGDGFGYGSSGNDKNDWNEAGGEIINDQ